MLRQARREIRKDRFIDLLKILDSPENIFDMNLSEGDLAGYILDTTEYQRRQITPSELSKGNDFTNQETIHSLKDRRRSWNGQGLAS